MKAMDKCSRILNICLHTHLFTVDFRGFTDIRKILNLRVDQNHSKGFSEYGCLKPRPCHLRPVVKDHSLPWEV